MLEQTDARSPRSKSLIVFFLLVAISVVATIGTAALSHWSISSYVAAVDANRKWAVRLELVAELEELADGVNAPANDVFATSDTALELKKQTVAYAKYRNRKSVIADGVLDGLPLGQEMVIRKGLLDAMEKVEQVNEQGTLALQTFANGDRQAAGALMARMDQSLRLFNAFASMLETAARKYQQLNFDSQAHKAAQARTVEEFIGMGVVALVIWLGIYGLKLYRVTASVADALASARDAANTANRAKSQFLANMSHEIRTPITAIVGFSDLMLDPKQTLSDRFDGLQTIRRHSTHLLALINDILDLSKIEAGKMTVECVQCELPLLLGEVLSMLQPRALENKLDIKLSLRTPVPRMITTDPLRLKQVLVNLLTNAIKFTPEGGSIQILVGCQKNGSLVFAITDSGIGMTAAQLSRLFQPFTQADSSTTRRFGGSGLGLTISKYLVHLLGGEIEVNSELGRGSTFSVSFNPGEVSGPMVTSADQALLIGTGVQENVDTDSLTLTGRVLLAEDGIDNQHFISAMLRKSGLEVTIAENGKLAVDLASKQAFDMIFMDMQMPEMDGYAATSKLRSRGLLIPIVALTAHAMAEDRLKCINAGCSDYLTKPIDRSKLLRMAAKYVAIGSSVNKSRIEIAKSDLIGRGKLASTAKLTSSFVHDPVMAEVLVEFIANLPEHVATINQFLRDNQALQLQDVFHQLKGAGGTYGYASITTQSAELESRMKTGALVVELEKDIQSLIALIRSVDGYDSSAERAACKEGVHAKSPHDR